MTYDIEITWKEGATDEERGEVTEFVKAVNEELKATDFPAAIQAIKIIRTDEQFSATPVK